MYLEIYIDTLFFINFFMDFIVILLSGKLQKEKCRWIRFASAAAAGAASACVCAVWITMNPIFKFLAGCAGTCILMAYIAYKPDGMRKLLDCSVTMIIVSWILGGLLNNLYYTTGIGYYMKYLLLGEWYTKTDFWHVVLCSAAGGFFFLLWKKKKQIREKTEELLFETKLFYQGKTITLKGFLDTGNDLKEPVFGRPVIIVEFENLKELFDNPVRKWLEAYEEHKNMDNLPELDIMPAIKMIPYHSIGKESGLLTGVVLDKIEIRSGKQIIEREHITAAAYNGKLSGEGDYQVILHKALI